MMDWMKLDFDVLIILIKSWSLLLIFLWFLYIGKEKELWFEEGVWRFYSYFEIIGME